MTRLMTQNKIYYRGLILKSLLEVIYPMYHRAIGSRDSTLQLANFDADCDATDAH